jgi:hypothetical protein
VEVAQGLAVGADQGRLGIGEVVLAAELAHQRLGAAQVRAGHVREQVVLDLVVEAAEEDVDNAAAAHVAGGQDLASQEVELPAMSLSSILYLPPQRLMPAGPGDGGGR